MVNCTGNNSSSFSDLFCSVLVDRMFFRVWSRCPLMVAAEKGAYFLNAAVVTPGIFVM